MVVENKAKKLCCFYVSDFHLEMILIPYINNKCDEKIVIKTEKDLKDSIEIVVSKMNIKQESKEKILKLEWNSDVDIKIENNSNIIVIGSEEYIKDVNKQIHQMDFDKVNIVDCYEFEDTKDRMNEMIKRYDYSLNTIGIKNIE